MSTPQQQQQRKRSDMLSWAGEVGKYEKSDIKLPDGVESYRLDPGTHLIDLMPYVVSDLSTTFRVQRADPGFEHPERQFSTHRIRLPNGKGQEYTCLWETFGEPCPVCKWMNGEGLKVDAEYAKTLYPSQRHLWVVNDKPGDFKNPMKVFKAGFKNKGMGFGEQMTAVIMAEVAKGNEEARYFYDLETGKTLQIVVKELTGGGFKYNAVTRIDFLPRRYKYPREILKYMPNLDAIPVRMTFQELQSTLLGESSSHASEPSSNGTIPATEPIAQESDQTENWATQPDPEPEKWTPKIGDDVTFEYKGKTLRGKIVVINVPKALAKVDCGTKPENIVALTDLSPYVEPEPEPVADDEWATEPTEGAAEPDGWDSPPPDDWATPAEPAKPVAKTSPAKKPTTPPPPADNDGWDEEPVPAKAQPTAKGGKKK